MTSPPGGPRRARRAFWRDERGSTAIEYALIAGAIFLAIIASVSTVGPKLATIFTDAGNNLK